MRHWIYSLLYETCICLLYESWTLHNIGFMQLVSQWRLAQKHIVQCTCESTTFIQSRYIWGFADWSLCVVFLHRLGNKPRILLCTFFVSSFDHLRTPSLLFLYLILSSQCCCFSPCRCFWTGTQTSAWSPPAGALYLSPQQLFPHNYIILGGSWEIPCSIVNQSTSCLTGAEAPLQHHQS